jgi:hypothetical protein
MDLILEHVFGALGLKIRILRVNLILSPFTDLLTTPARKHNIKLVTMCVHRWLENRCVLGMQCVRLAVISKTLGISRLR